MLSLHDNRRYFLYRTAADMRKCFDGLSGLVHQQMKQRVVSGDVFIFLNKRRNQVKLLAWEKDALAVFHKRLEKGTFKLPAAEEAVVHLSSLQLRLILDGGPFKIDTAKEPLSADRIGNEFFHIDLFLHGAKSSKGRL